MEISKALALIGRMRLEKIPAVMEIEGGGNVSDLEEYNWETRVNEMLEYCQTIDTDWIDETSLNFIEDLSDRFANDRRHMSEKQQKWVQDLYVRFKQQ